MNRISVLPTPQFVQAKVGEGDPDATGLKRYAFLGEAEEILSVALGFFHGMTPCNEEESDLILTCDSACAERFFEVDDGWFQNPYAAEQGYLLWGDGKGKVVIYAKTQTGLAYGLTTLLQLPALEGEYLIKDHPDFRYRANKWLLWAETEVWSYDFGDGEEAYYNRILRKLDLCLKYKINMVFFDAWGPDHNRAPHYKSLMKACNRAARARGIKLIFGAYTMGYGLSGHPFGKNFGKVHKNRLSYPDGEVYECLGTMKVSRRKNNGQPFVMAREFGTCLSNDALMEEKLEELCAFVEAVEPGALYLHNMDSHLIHKTLWLARCERCRAKWPNDDLFAKDGMAGAFADFFDRLNGRLQGVKTDSYDASRDLLIFNVSPGYLEYHVGDDFTETSAAFWEKVQEYATVKENVYPLFRELYYDRAGEKERIREHFATKRLSFGIIAFCGGDGFYSDDLFPTTALFHSMMKGAEVMITCSGNAFAEPLQLFNAEYMWNSTNSGFYQPADLPRGYEAFTPLYEQARAGGYRPKEIFEAGGMLDRICQKLYGEDARVMGRFFRLRGENGECPAPHPCNRELGTHGSKAIFDFCWDHTWEREERLAFTQKVREILRISEEGMSILEAGTTVDTAEYRRMLGLNLPVLRLLAEYLGIYHDMEEYFNDPAEAKEKEALFSCIAACKDHVNAEKSAYGAQKLCFADLLGGALARREEILENLAYDLTLMEESLKTGARIPANRLERNAGAWW